LYDTHQKTIGEFARKSPGNMAAVYTFVIATIQQQIETVPTMTIDLLRDGSASPHAWGWKAQAMDFIRANKVQVYDTSMAIYRGHACPDDCQHELLKYFADLTGLGLAKGGFMVQLCFGLSGCLDSHNIARFGINPNEFRAQRYKNAKSQSLRSEIVRAYHIACSNAGGTRSLWDTWCEYVASLRGGHLTAHEISALHCVALGLPHE
jgi:hypothetical protein